MSTPGPKFRFTADSPLIIQIFPKDNGEWDIQPSPGNIDGISNAPTYRQVMDARKENLIGRGITKEWFDRSKDKTKHPVPHFIAEKDHIPVVVATGEWVQFRSQANKPFVIWVDRDPNVTPIPGTPQNPFGFTLPTLCQNGESGKFEVQPRVASQRFYKCTAHIDLGGGQTALVDPDVIASD
jgi:hypothetical protein